MRGKNAASGGYSFFEKRRQPFQDVLPTVSYSAYLLKKSGKERVYFLMSRIGQEARIADISIDTDELMEWKDAYAVASETEAQFPEIHNVFTGATVPFMGEALESNDFHPYRKDPVMIYDPSYISSCLGSHLKCLREMPGIITAENDRMRSRKGAHDANNI